MLSSQVLGNNEAAITPRVRKVLRGAFRVASSWRPCCSSRRTVCPIMQREFFYPNVFGVRSADRCSSCAWNILDHCSLSRSASFFFGMSHSGDYSETLLHQDSAVAVDNIQHFFFFAPSPPLLVRRCIPSPCIFPKTDHTPESASLLRLIYLGAGAWVYLGRMLAVLSVVLALIFVKHRHHGADVPNTA